MTVYVLVLESFLLGHISVLAALHGNVDLCLTSIVLVGCLLSVLAYNSHPARIFLGDSGSLLIGYLTSFFGIALTEPSNAGDQFQSYSIMLPFFFIVVPCADCVWVMIARMLKNRRPWRADKTHVHHSVLRLGLGHRYAVLLLLAISSIISLVAILFKDKSDDILFLLLICFVQSITWKNTSFASQLQYIKEWPGENIFGCTKDCSSFSFSYGFRISFKIKIKIDDTE